jgi:predicted O-methyltransferase YrrM
MTIEMPNSHMMIEKVIGNLLAIFVSMTESQNILEIGTFTGYSVAMMVSGLKGGKITTLEENKQYYDAALKNLAKEITNKKVKVFNQEGFEWLKQYHGEPFDIIFIDARKESFSDDEIIDEIYRKLSLNGLLIVDNSLARGTILNPIVEWQRLTDVFNRKIACNSRYRTILLPVRDGLLIAQKVN